MPAVWRLEGDHRKCNSALTAIRQFLFSEGDRFAGMASPAAVREGLCSAFPELAGFDGTLRAGPASKDVDREINRTTTLWNHRMAADEPNLKVAVRWHLLAEWLGERFLTRCIRVEPRTGLTMVQVQQVVDSLLPDVPIEQLAELDAPPAADAANLPDQQPPAKQRYELKVVDRDAFALELAREWVRTGIPRAPLR